MTTFIAMIILLIYQFLFVIITIYRKRVLFIDKKLMKSIISVALILVIVLVLMNPFVDDRPISIIDLLEDGDNFEDHTGLVTEDITSISITVVSEEAENFTFEGRDLENLIVFLDSTIIEKSKERLVAIASPAYLVDIGQRIQSIIIMQEKDLCLNKKAIKQLSA